MTRLLKTLLICTVCVTSAIAAEKKKEPQYKHGKISIPGAVANEPVRKTFSQDLAVRYVEKGALAWKRARNCVACHTTGSYLQMRPALTPILGQASKEIRQLFVAQRKKYDAQAAKARKKFRVLQKGIRPTEIAYIASGLAEYDAHGAGKTSPETAAALKLMLNVQSRDGGYGNITCWPPFESSRYQGATVAAMALATAPGYLKSVKDKNQLEKIAKLKSYLRKTKPAHNYERLILLWADTRWNGLITKERRNKIIKMVLSKQQADGGWSIRSFGTPDTWGKGSRKNKLQAEKNYKTPDSDGHQTGLAMIVLLDAGISKDTPAIKKAAKWLLSNQRASGRWWTRSLNTDKSHFITYSGTLYPLVALQKLGKLKSIVAAE